VDHDPLTDLLHRRAFNARLESALCTASAEQPLSLLYLDLDFFKQVNSAFGHLGGDHALHHVASLLPTEDGVVPARGGGEEFWLLVPGLDEIASLHYACQLCKLISNQPAEYRGVKIALTVSIGVSTTETPIAPADISEQADSALYAAKVAGRNRALHFRALEREALHASEDIRIHSFEAMQRVVSDRAERFIAQRRRQLFQSLQNQADRDRVTGLFNRGYLDRRMIHAHQEARETHPLCVALIDVDHFGAVNKTHDWPTGDLTLRGVADLIRQNVRESDWVARYGGEEIAVILPDTPLAVAVQVVERVREAVARHMFLSLKGEPFSVTISAGVVDVRPGEPILALWQRVSEKALGAKGAGRNRVLA
jgi:two-component system cell cycle response regulator